MSEYGCAGDNFVLSFGALFSIIQPMPSQVTRMDLETAKHDLQSRTLAPIGYDFGRLVYLSSLRNFGTGEYHHHGLAHSYSESVAASALAICHQEVFYRLAFSPLEILVEQIECFIRSSRQDLAKTVNAWETLEAYRVMIPSVCNHLAAGLFRSNVRTAMELLKSRRPSELKRQQSSLRLLLPGQ